MSFKDIRAAVLTVSDSVSRGSREDLSGALLVGLLEKRGVQVLRRDVVRDDESEIQNKFKFFSDELMVDLVLSCGGTGLGPRDVTPEATRAVVDKEATGMTELMRFEGVHKTKTAALSRAVAGIRGRTLIVNLPGSPGGAVESWEAIADIIPHALAMMQGQGH